MLLVIKESECELVCGFFGKCDFLLGLCLLGICVFNVDDIAYGVVGFDGCVEYVGDVERNEGSCLHILHNIQPSD